MFGYTISDLVDDRRGKVYGCPKITEETGVAPPAMDSFNAANSAIGTGLFDFAALDEAYTYIRGFRGLKIPTEWETAVPKFQASGVAA